MHRYYARIAWPMHIHRHGGYYLRYAASIPIRRWCATTACSHPTSYRVLRYAAASRASLLGEVLLLLRYTATAGIPHEEVVVLTDGYPYPLRGSDIKGLAEGGLVVR